MPNDIIKTPALIELIHIKAVIFIWLPYFVKHKPHNEQIFDIHKIKFIELGQIYRKRWRSVSYKIQISDYLHKSNYLRVLRNLFSLEETFDSRRLRFHGRVLIYKPTQTTWVEDIKFCLWFFYWKQIDFYISFGDVNFFLFKTW